MDALAHSGRTSLERFFKGAKGETMKTELRRDIASVISSALNTSTLQFNDADEILELFAAWIETQRNDVPATGEEFAASIRAERER